jgi:hypothetical protein
METAHPEKRTNSKVIQQTPGCRQDKAMVPGGRIYSHRSQGHRENTLIQENCNIDAGLRAVSNRSARSTLGQF